MHAMSVDEIYIYWQEEILQIHFLGVHHRTEDFLLTTLVMQSPVGEKTLAKKKKKRQEPPPRNNPFSSPQSLSFVDSNEEQAIGEGSTACTPRKELHLQTKNPIFFGWQTAQKGFLLRNGVLGQKTEWTRPTVLKIRHIWTPQNEPHKFTVRDDT